MKARGLWEQIVKLACGGEEVMHVITRGVWRKVGDDGNTLFWCHNWGRGGDQPLKALFPRLYVAWN